jgi:hypothetical protein
MDAPGAAPGWPDDLLGPPLDPQFLPDDDLFGGGAGAPGVAAAGAAAAAVGLSLLDDVEDEDGFLDSLDLDAVGASSGGLLPPPSPLLLGRGGAGGAGASPTSSESRARAASADAGGSGSDGAGAASRRAAAAAAPPLPEEDEAKRAARMARNRENAHLSRQRKKAQLAELAGAAGALRAQNGALAALVQRLAAETVLLRAHLGAACAKAGVAVPAVPSAMAAARAAGAAARPSGAPPAAPLAALPAVAAPPPLEAPPTAPPARKRARTTSLAGGAFLALFSVFLLAGPLAPAPAALSSGGAAGAAYSFELAALPAAAAGGGGAFAPPGRGRALLALREEPPEAAARRGLGAAMNATLAALLAEPAARRAPEDALRCLRQLAPAALVLDSDPAVAVVKDASADATDAADADADAFVAAAAAAGPLAASAAFPALAGPLFGAAGLHAPRACRKVLEFTPAELPPAARTRRGVEKFLLAGAAGAAGFRGRRLALPLGGAAADALRALGDADSPRAGAGVEPLRIPDAAEPAGAADAANGADNDANGDDGPLPAAGAEPSLVSVLLPANASADGSAGAPLAAVDRVFVVLLHPGDRYAAYSCALPRALLV